MREFLLDYHPVHPTTWVYLSSLLMIGVFFKFSRFWSVRNLDLVLLILLSPGLLLVQFGDAAGEAEMARALAVPQKQEAAADAPGQAPGDEPAAAEKPGIDGPVASQPSGDQAEFLVSDVTDRGAQAADGDSPALTGNQIKYFGFIWLLGATGLLLVRLLVDPTMVRRPLLEPNLSCGGLIFLGCSLFVFLMANVINSPISEDDLKGPEGARQLLAGVAVEEGSDDLRRHGPGNAVLHLLPSVLTMPQQWNEGKSTSSRMGNVRAAKTMAVVSHLAVLIGIIAIGYRHFDNIQMGIGAATLYLLLPYTAQMTGRVDHVLPAALLVWAVLCYRRPLAAGMFIGLAIGVVYYPLFLLPLWVSFYWQRGLMRFSTGVLITLTVMVLSLVFISPDLAGFWSNVQKMFGIWFPVMERLRGIWGLGWEPIYRLPVLAAFIAISGALALWPAQKNLGTLLSCTAAVMAATQFWHGYGGGLYVAWYLPLTLLTIFRPNLEDRMALTVLGEGWFPRRHKHNRRGGVEIAA